MTINEHTLTSACVYYIGLQYIPSPCSSDLLISRWRWCYKSHGSFPMYLASEVQERSNAPVPGQRLETTIGGKSCTIPPYVPGINPPRMAADKCINDCPKGNSFVSPKLEETSRLRINKPQCFLRDQAQCFVIPLNSKLEKHYKEISCFTPARSQICRGFKEHNLITCKSKVHVVVSLREFCEFCPP